MGSEKVYVVDVKRNSLDDGPGIRSVVFFKGCTLRCVWCQNPETLSPHPEIQREMARCQACRACERACPQDVARPAEQDEDKRKCKVCGACVQACAVGARRVAGTSYDPDELAELLARDEPFYRHSGGGVTFSGGEPAMYPAFAGEVARRLKERKIHVLLETAGHVDWEKFSGHLLPHVSTIYFDIKLADDQLHRRHVGVSNSRILENLRRLAGSGFPDLLPRLPLVPGITDAPENLQAVAELLGDIGLARLMLLPYNPLWLSKRRVLGMDLPYRHDAFMSADDVQACREVMERTGLAVVG